MNGYFDWAATSPPDEDILKEALQKSSNAFANPSSAHKAGTQAALLLNEARNKSAQALGVNSEQIVFTSGGTEANHLPILNLLQRPVKGSILISAIEHPAVKEQAQSLKNCGWNVITLMPETDGIIKPETVIKSIQNDTALVCVMAVNNETGAIQPIYDIADAISAHCEGKKKPKFHVDAVQAIGKIPLTLSYKGIDSAAISAHKMCGPRGIGICYFSKRQEPFIRGGGQENGLRPGTENVFGAFALALCLQKYATNLQEKYVTMQNHTKEFLQNLCSITGCKIIPSVRLQKSGLYSPYIIQAAFNKIPANVLVRALSENGIYISTGSACSSRKNSRPILEAMQIDKETSLNAVRFSFGYTTAKSDLDNLLQEIKKITDLF